MNVLYITVDALRADHVLEDIMPNICSFVDSAIEFKKCVANGPGTPWSFPSLLASRYAGSTTGFGIPGPGDRHPTLAEILSEAGFQTAGFTDNRFASSAYHYDRGFDEMRDSGATSKIKGVKQYLRENLDKDGFLFQSLLKSYHVIDGAFVDISERDSRFTRAETLVDGFLDWTERRQNWFAWLHPMDVHAPYEAPAEYQRQYLNEPVSRVRSQKLARAAVHHPNELTEEDWELQQNLYKAECRYLDDQLSRLLNELSLRGVRDEIIIVFTADHGDMHGEHDRGGHPQEFWEEIIRVPLAIDVPDRGDGTIAEQTALIDVPPTIVDSLGIDVPDVWDGHSLNPLIEKEAAPREHIFIDVGAELNFEHAGVRRSDGWKLLRHDGTEYLFDLSENPSESPHEDRKKSDPDAYQGLTTAIDDHLEEMQQRREVGLSGVEDEQKIEDHLKELGYIE